MTKGGPYVLEGKMSFQIAFSHRTPQFILTAFKNGFPENWDMYRSQWRMFIIQQRDNDDLDSEASTTILSQNSGFQVPTKKTPPVLSQSLSKENAKIKAKTKANISKSPAENSVQSMPNSSARKSTSPKKKPSEKSVVKKKNNVIEKGEDDKIEFLSKIRLRKELEKCSSLDMKDSDSQNDSSKSPIKRISKRVQKGTKNGKNKAEEKSSTAENSAKVSSKPKKSKIDASKSEANLAGQDKASKKDKTPPVKLKNRKKEAVKSEKSTKAKTALRKKSSVPDGAENSSAQDVVEHKNEESVEKPLKRRGRKKAYSPSPPSLKVSKVKTPVKSRAKNVKKGQNSATKGKKIEKSNEPIKSLVVVLEKIHVSGEKPPESNEQMAQKEKRPRGRPRKDKKGPTETKDRPKKEKPETTEKETAKKSKDAKSKKEQENKRK